MPLTGECCMRDHANAIPPWTCECLCHIKRTDTGGAMSCGCDREAGHWCDRCIIKALENRIEKLESELHPDVNWLDVRGTVMGSPVYTRRDHS
jgi:hypothetical protein